MGLPENNLYGITEWACSSELNQEPSSEIEIWPGDETMFVCKANRGRSIIAMNFFRKKFPGTRAGSAGVTDYSNRSFIHPPNSVIKALEWQDLQNVRFNISQTIRQDMVNPRTDVFVFCETELLPSWVVQQARNVIAIPLLDPSEFAHDEHQLQKHVTHCTVAIKYLVYHDLKPMILKIHNGEMERFKQPDDIYYPYPCPYRVSEAQFKYSPEPSNGLLYQAEVFG